MAVSPDFCLKVPASTLQQIESFIKEPANLRSGTAVFKVRGCVLKHDYVVKFHEGLATDAYRRKQSDFSLKTHHKLGMCNGLTSATLRDFINEKIQAKGQEMKQYDRSQAKPTRTIPAWPQFHPHRDVTQSLPKYASERAKLDATVTQTDDLASKSRQMATLSEKLLQKQQNKLF